MWQSHYFQPWKRIDDPVQSIFMKNILASLLCIAGKVLNRIIGEQPHSTKNFPFPHFPVFAILLFYCLLPELPIRVSPTFLVGK